MPRQEEIRAGAGFGRGALSDAMKMRMRRYGLLGAALLALGIAGHLAPGRAQGEVKPPAPAVEPDRPSVERRLVSVRTLIESSSAAREIEASANPDAIARRNQARQTARLASVALEGGDLKSAGSLLEEAARLLIGAARLARGERSREDSDQREVSRRMESARALLAAQRRISAEKPAAGTAELATKVETLLDEAKAHAEAHRYAAARPLVEQAYLMAKASVSAMRGGDTLVRSLNFASKEEEYHYEIDRNDTHRMLVTLLVQRKGTEGPHVRDAVERAQGLRGEAETSAERRDFVEAIRLLEESTRELVRAIRGAGVYIPG